jgi:ribosomal protein S18 acetylase RimI-like enzyme
MRTVTATGPDVVNEAAAVIERSGPGGLHIDDLTIDDLEWIAWSGEPRHIVVVREALQRVGHGEVEYLALRVPSGRPVAKVGIDFVRYPESGYLWQFATHPGLQGRGIGSLLMEGAEARIVRRGLHTARINVEHENARARALYERLGYKSIGNSVESWERADTSGALSVYRAEVALMRKRLT